MKVGQGRIKYCVIVMIFQILLCLFLCFSTTSGCPEDPEPPCTCTTIGYQSRYITCKGVENEQQLERSMRSMKSSRLPVRYVEIFDSSLNYLPSGLFKGLRVTRLFLAGSSMTSLSDAETAFEGLEDSLEVLQVHECNFLGGWQWSHLKNLQSLKELQTVKVGTIDVDEEVKEIAHLDLRKVLLTQNSISYLHDTAFSTFHNLQTLSLKVNPIKEVKRSMLPNPAPQLRQIILSQTELERLPADFFTGMPALISVVLEGNKLLTVDRDTFAPVWNQLDKLNLLDNPLRCDCRIAWLTKVSFPRNVWARCAEPSKVKGKDLEKLAPKELWC